MAIPLCLENNFTDNCSAILIVPLMKGSVWSSLPPINNSSTNHSKPIILTVASMDSASFFRDKNLGAESPISVSSSSLVLTLSLWNIYFLMMPFLSQISG
jgi:hypothetical protein